MRAHAALACLLTCSTILNTTRNTLQRRVFISFLLLTPPHTSLSRFQHLHPLRFSSSSSKMESTTTNTDTQKEDNHATKEQTANSNMQKDNTNEQDTPAVQFLKNNNVEFSVHRYEYLEKGGTARSSNELGVDEHIVVKTLVMEKDGKEPIIVLMHGDKKVDTNSLAKAIPAKKVRACSAEDAFSYTGYMVGGTSPFGTKNKLPIYLQKTILDIENMYHKYFFLFKYINGGGRGYLVKMASKELVRTLSPILVDVAK